MAYSFESGVPSADQYVRREQSSFPEHSQGLSAFTSKETKNTFVPTIFCSSEINFAGYFYLDVTGSQRGRSTITNAG